MKHIWTFHAKVEKVVDGDTLKLTVDKGFRDYRVKENFRLARINAPELKKEERPEGLASKDWLENYLKIWGGGKVLIKSSKHGKYRWVVEVYVSSTHDDEYDINVNDELVKSGHAVYVDY